MCEKSVESHHFGLTPFPQSCGCGFPPIDAPCPSDSSLEPTMRLATLAAFLLCTTLMSAHTTAAELPANIEADKGFMACYTSLADMIKADKRYKRIPLDTEEQANAFVVELHKLYTKQITDVAFFTWMAMNYPGHDYEQVVIEEHVKRCKR